MEQFPGLQLRCNATECVRCSRDKNSPKLYSPGNNMNPGSQPLELQVSILQSTEYISGTCTIVTLWSMSIISLEVSTVLLL